MLESAPAHLSYNDRYLLLVFPTQSTGSQNGGVGVHEAGNQELGLVLENLQDGVVVCFLDGLHYQIAGLAQTAEEDECLRTGEGGEVGASLAQHLARELENLVGHLVTLAGGDAYIQ